ncbi:MAG: arylsulfatase [Candidatus Udaeobacter sp.]
MKSEIVTKNSPVIHLLVAILSLLPSALTAQQINRTVLPVPEPKPAVITELDARKATPPPRFEVKAPKGAPNVVIILLDNFGFGDPSTFGGPIQMPTLDRLAQTGLRYNNLKLPPLCSPSRIALLTGRNSHSCNFGTIGEIATAFPGNTGMRPSSITTLPEILRLNGYNTAMFGKCHELGPWELSPVGPFDRWPVHSGFEKFYGFMSGEADLFHPVMYDNLTRVDLPRDPNYYASTDITDKAILWLRSQRSLAPDKPFFVYYSAIGTHGPFQVPDSWRDKYKGKFDKGWDQVRKETLDRQIKLGVVPPGTELAPKPEGIQEWDQLTADEKKVFARYMEIYAAFAEITDHEIGRFLKEIENLGAMDNTLIFYVTGDNGSVFQGGPNGAFNEMSVFNALPEPLDIALKHLDEFGGPKSHILYPNGWAFAGATPFGWGHQVASYGGICQSMVVHWPKGLKEKGGLRTQWHHIIDIAPTVLEAAGLPEPGVVHGVPQQPIQGVSMLYTFNDAKAPSRRHTQYFEMAGNRGIYQDGWFATTVHRPPWEAKPRATFENDKWELYDVERDFSCAHDLAATYPGKLEKLKGVFLEEAVKYHVLPLDDRAFERFNPVLAGRPDLMGDRTELTVYPGMNGLGENAFINVKNRSFVITADIEVPEADAEGVLLAQGGKMGGWSLYVKDGKPKFAYNYLAREIYTIAGPARLPAGPVTLRFDFAYDGGKPGAGGMGLISINGKKVAQGRIEHTHPNAFGAETTDVGENLYTVVTDDYKEGDNKFTGTIDKVTVKLGESNLSQEAQKANEEMSIEGLLNLDY